MKSTFIATCLFAAFAGIGAADDAALWDLSKNEIPPTLTAGKIEKTKGGILLRDGAAFAVPAEAFPDQKNFTVQVTASLCDLVQDGIFTAMNKQDEGDNGFAFSMNYRESPWYARQVTAVVNNILMTARAINGQRGPQTNTLYTFTVAVRNGYASFYIDDAPYKACYMEMVPNGAPLWIGRNADKKAKPLPVVVSSVKVFGANHAYVSKKEPASEFPRGAVAGKGWALDIPKIEHPEWPKVLIYGDSISMGYSGYFIPDQLKHNTYVFHCCHFVGGDVPEAALTEMAGRYRFDAVVFNNGLHSLHWTPEAVSDAVVQERMRKLAQCFKTGAPQAKLYYLLTTPHTAAKPAPDKPVASLGEKNDVVVRLNTLSAQVMREQGIEILDVYTPLSKQLGWASGDGYHWQSPAYQFISQEISARIASAIEKK